MKAGKIYSTPPQNNKPGYIIYTQPDQSPNQSAVSKTTNQSDNANNDRYILYWPYDANGNSYTFQKNDVVQFDIENMLLIREATFEVDVAVNLSLLKKVNSKK